jgi:tyrosinase-like protein
MTTATGLPDRRTFLIGSVAFGSSLTLLTSLSAAPISVLPRKSMPAVETNPAELQILRDAIGLLKAKDSGGVASDGWEAIANPHINHCFTGDDREIHFSWWFWPWHRAYLLAMEKRLQHVVSEPALRLPYWDWFSVRDIPGPLGLPTYRTASGVTKPNPLFDATRAKSAAERPPPLNTVTITNAVLGGYASEADLLKSSNFSNVGGRLAPAGGARSTTGIVEAGPHNNLHVWIGGLSGNMAQAFSPRDPAFLLHHSNIDRLWTIWASLTTGGAHNNPTDADWLNRTFPMPHPSGVGTQSYKISELLDTTALGYNYEGETIRVAQASGSQGGAVLSIKMNSRPLDLSGGQARTELRSLAAPDTARLRELAPSRPGTLILDGITLPTTTTSISVYLQSENLKENDENTQVGIYTFLNPTGHAINTSAAIPLPQRIGELIAKQPNLGFSIVVPSPNRERLGGFMVQELRLTFE